MDEHESNADERAGQAASQPQAPRRGVWRRVAGDGSHMGFWTLPVFVMTALGGAIIAGTIANVYYAQQVSQLEEETRAARTAAEVAAADIEDAREDALDAINEQVDAVRSQLEAARPIDSPSAAGVVALQVEIAPAPLPRQQSGSGDTDQPAGDGQVDGALVASAEEEPTQAPPPATSDGTATPPAPPAPAVGSTVRNAVGFVVSIVDGQAFIATTYGAIADPNARDGVAVAVTVRSDEVTVRGVVHAWDEGRDVAMIRVASGALPVLPWRPASVAVQPGDITVLAAVTPSLAGVQLPGRVGAVTADAIITDLPLDPVFDGAPVVDSLGRVVGLQASTSSPFGGAGGSVIPAAQLCVKLITGCDQLEQADPSDEQPEPADAEG